MSKPDSTAVMARRNKAPVATPPPSGSGGGAS